MEPNRCESAERIKPNLVVALTVGLKEQKKQLHPRRSVHECNRPEGELDGVFGGTSLCRPSTDICC